MRGKPVFLIILISIIYFAGCTSKPVDKSLATYHGLIADYQGNKKLIVAFTASYASVWKMSELELRKLDMSKFDLCILDQAVDKDEFRNFGITFVPTVALILDGKIIKQVQNLSSIEQLQDW